MKNILLSSLAFAIPLFGQTAHICNITPHTQLIIETGDITSCPVNAIVNAANEQLLGGAGVCGAIFNKAGWKELQAACNTYPETNNVRCPTGQARITKSFNLKQVGIEHIIHAVGPDCRIIKDVHQQDKLLTQAYTHSLALADQHNLTSIAFPFISSAIYAFPRERAARKAVEAIRDYMRTHRSSKITTIHMILFSQKDFDLFHKTTQELCVK